MKKRISKTIFREYDIRGIINETLFEADAYLIGKGFCSLSSNKNIKLGICGEHGGDPKSIIFFNGLKLDYVSCSPYRVPIARLAAAQAEINGNE